MRARAPKCVSRPSGADEMRRSMQQADWLHIEMTQPTGPVEGIVIPVCLKEANRFGRQVVWIGVFAIGAKDS